MEETSTQVELAFTAALDAEGLLAAVDARHDDGRVDLGDDDDTRPILLAVSDNGPQMTSGSTREFLALCAIAQHFGRPGTPTAIRSDQASQPQAAHREPHSCQPAERRTGPERSPRTCSPTPLTADASRCPAPPGQLTRWERPRLRRRGRAPAPGRGPAVSRPPGHIPRRRRPPQGRFAVLRTGLRPPLTRPPPPRAGDTGRLRRAQPGRPTATQAILQESWRALPQRPA